jgi:hypothetical protein
MEATWTEELELKITTPCGETMTFDIPSMLHDSGLLGRLTHTGSIPLRVSKETGSYVGVCKDSRRGYVATVGKEKVYGASARETARLRVTHMGMRKRKAPEEEEDEECTFVKERTREDRDAEGRANAISL